MENLKNLLKCKQCHEIFQGTPIVLSCCGETICSIHLEQEESKEKVFKCLICETTHEMQNKTFPSCKIA